jgi:hypothetical protein
MKIFFYIIIIVKLTHRCINPITSQLKRSAINTTDSHGEKTMETRLGCIGT